MADKTDLDPILSARLDLLEQVVSEVNDVIAAMARMTEALDRVDSCLVADGDLHELAKTAENVMSDASTRLEIVVKSGAARLSEHDVDRLRQALNFAGQAKDAIDGLHKEREQAHEAFRGVRQWSVARLGKEPLETASIEYRRILTGIRRSPQPWRRYEAELRGRGQPLYTSYLELLGSLAMRGYVLDADALASTAAAIGGFFQPMRSMAGNPMLRSPLALLGTRHVPLGYLQWSLWALPLAGRAEATDLIKQAFDLPIPDRLQIVCADAYATFVLGPSYPFAAIFLELDPDARPDIADSEWLRAPMLLELLPKLADPEVRGNVEEFTERLREAWEQAVAALGGGPAEVPAEDRAVVDDFVTELRTGLYRETRYDTTWIATADELVDHLTNGTALAEDRAPGTKDLLTGMWLARLYDPEKAADIHERARALPARKRGGAKEVGLSPTAGVGSAAAGDKGARQ